MLLACIALVCAPVVIVWSMGIYDRFELHRHQRALEKIEASAVEAFRGAGPETFARKLDDFARAHQVYARVMDGSGAPRASSSVVFGEGRISRRRWFAEAADFFFGPQGPPGLLEHERIDASASKDVVQVALQSPTEGHFRSSEQARMFVFYRARALSEAPARVLLLARLSRRNVRSLYDFRYQLLKLTVALLAGGLFMGAWMGWSVVGPTGRLSDRIRDYMETGARPSLALERQDEIGQISRDFEALAKRLEARTERTAKVAADFAHDLKNPISAVRATAELLETPMEDARRLRIAKALSDASAHMQRSVDAMLALARLDERLRHEPKTEVYLDALLAQLLEEYRARPDLDAVNLELEVSGEPAALLGMEARLVELARNLIDNALVFAQSSVRIELRFDAQIALRVSDDGPGVSQGNRTKIFARFFSARPEGKPAGSGLGLAIVQTIAEAHEGTLHLQVSGPLPGACFEVRFTAENA